MMEREAQVLRALSNMAEMITCRACGTRIRFGDMECSHCGADLENDLRTWAERLIDSLTTGPP